MIMRGENRRTEGKSCPSTTVSTTNATWTGLESNLVLGEGTPATNRQSHDMATEGNSSSTYKTLISASQKTYSSPFIKTSLLNLFREVFGIHVKNKDRVSSCHVVRKLTTAS
jgi:hypothetical protein